MANTSFYRKAMLSSALLTLAVIGMACSGQSIGNQSGSNSASTGDDGTRLSGAGATFPKPIYEKWASEYTKANPKVKVEYQSVGSGAGQKAILAKTSDFGASDSPMKDEDLKSASAEILHIPTVLGAVVLTYNLEGVKDPLKLTPEIVADIYLGKIKKWNDEKIKKDNSTAALPDTDILPIYRSDGSGTSAVFTSYLSKTVPDFKEKVGSSTQPSWLTGVGVGAKGNDGVMGQVKQTPNTIGYVELTFAKANNLPAALIKNKAGEFVDASLDNISAAAAESAAKMPDDLRIDITDTAGKSAYPISSYTYILVYREQGDAAKGKALVDFLWWAAHDGEKFTKDLHFAPLPESVVKRVETKINSITAGGKALRQ